MHRPQTPRLQTALPAAVPTGDLSMSSSWDEDLSGDFDEETEGSIDVPVVPPGLSRKPCPDGHEHLDTTKQMRIWSLMHGGGAVLSAKVNRTAKAVRYIATRRIRRATGGQPQTEQPSTENGE